MKGQHAASDGVTQRVRGNSLRHRHISEEFPGKSDTTLWALARSVRALVAERDALIEKIEIRQCATYDVAPGPDIGRKGQNTSMTQMTLAGSSISALQRAPQAPPVC
jgi:hypothetical protein